MIVKLFAFVLGLGLPIHAGLVTFLPDFPRFWKEFAVTTLFILLIKRFIITKGESLPHKEMYVAGGLYLALGGGQALILSQSDGFAHAFTAVRPLVLGVLFFLTILGYSYSVKKKFATGFVLGSFMSLVFGLWAHLGGGYEVLEAIYSTTISSWVPGQKIPLYHEANGIARMQGLSSGPVAFGHIMLIAGFLLRYVKKIPLWAKYPLWALLGAGVWLSASRGAVGGLALILMFRRAYRMRIITKYNAKKLTMMGLVVGAILLGGAFTQNPDLLSRAGTSDHFTKPIEAIKAGNQNPLWGSLGEIGIAKRAKNMAEKNNDYALIAENVWVDIYAQLGGVSLIFMIIMLYFVWRKIYWKNYDYFWAFIAVGMLATLWDMSPVGLGLWGSLALAVDFRHNAAKS